MAVRAVLEWLNSCSGCEIAILNIGEALIPLVSEHLDIVHAPILMDHKCLGQCGEGSEIEIPEADIGIVSGGVANTEHLEVLLAMREKCRLLIALGTCATHGGIPALMNGQGLGEGIKGVFATSGTDPCSVPDVGVPAALDRVYACDEKVRIDLFLPGCPPNPALIAEVLMAVAQGRDPVQPGKSVCDTCQVLREGKGAVTKVRRFLVNADYNAEEPVQRMRCLLEQGFMCMGPVTAAGCAAAGLPPSCIRVGVPCRGCFGPVRRDGNQMLDMMNALASNGIDFKSVVDRRSLLRFSGAHGLLRQIRTRPVPERG